MKQSVLGWVACGLLCAGVARADENVDFASQIKPILEASCIDCHGPDKQKGDLRLDQRESAVAHVVVPGKAAESELIERISLPPDHDDRMPAKGDPLSKEQIDLFRQWINQGAEYAKAEAEPKKGSVDFLGQIQPLFEEKCIECHGPQKQKGDLRLDQKEAALAESIVPGKPEESEVYKRIILPADDLDIMPAEGDPLNQEQIDLIYKWIAEGAAWPETQIAEAEKEKEIDYFEEIKPILSDLTTDQVDLLKRWMEQQGGQWPSEKPAPVNLVEVPVTDAEKQAISTLQETGAMVTRVAQNVNWLRASFRLQGNQVTDEDIAPLAEMENLIEIDLANTGVTDAALAHLKDLPNLTHLDLNNTAVTDEGLAHLSNLNNLVYLNLYGTQVTDAGLKHLTGLETLQKLYLWQTEVTAQGVQQFQRARPATQVIRGWDIASKEGEGASDEEAQEQAKNPEEE